MKPTKQPVLNWLLLFINQNKPSYMSKRKQIDDITTTQANSICLRFMGNYWHKQTDKSEKNLRTVARDYCRSKGMTPKEAIAQPLPR